MRFWNIQMRTWWILTTWFKCLVLWHWSHLVMRKLELLCDCSSFITSVSFETTLRRILQHPNIFQSQKTIAIAITTTTTTTRILFSFFLVKMKNNCQHSELTTDCIIWSHRELSCTNVNLTFSFLNYCGSQIIVYFWSINFIKIHKFFCSTTNSSSSTQFLEFFEEVCRNVFRTQQ